MKKTDEEVHGSLAELFTILLNWDLNLSFHTQAEGPTLYTVTDDGAEILSRVSRTEIEEWVTARQAREICGNLLAQSPLDGLQAWTEPDPLQLVQSQVAAHDKALEVMRRELDDLREQVTMLSSRALRHPVEDSE